MEESWLDKLLYGLLKFAMAIWAMIVIIWLLAQLGIVILTLFGFGH